MRFENPDDDSDGEIDPAAVEAANKMNEELNEGNDDEERRDHLALRMKANLKRIDTPHRSRTSSLLTVSVDSIEEM